MNFPQFLTYCLYFVECLLFTPWNGYPYLAKICLAGIIEVHPPPQLIEFLLNMKIYTFYRSEISAFSFDTRKQLSGIPDSLLTAFNSTFQFRIKRSFADAIGISYFFDSILLQ